MCEHDKIQVVREGRSYVWYCALCGDRMLAWDKKVWSVLGLEPLKQGEGFNFSIVERGAVDDGLQA